MDHLISDSLIEAVYNRSQRLIASEETKYKSSHLIKKKSTNHTLQLNRHLVDGTLVLLI